MTRMLLRVLFGERGAVFVQKRSVLLSVAIVRAGGNAESGRCGAAECGGHERMRREIVDKFESGVATQTNTVAILPPMTGCMRGELRFSALFCGQRLRIFGAKAGGFDGFCGLLRRCGRDNAKPNRKKTNI